MQGLLLINKPESITSFGVCAKVKWLLNQKRVGHTGTLDPMATGVLPMLVGRSTVLCGYLLDADKEYIATVKLGITTDTLDKTGNILSEKSVKVTRQELNNVLQDFLGKQLQTPPMYSALKKDGVRLYDLARRGTEVEREQREIEIFELELLEFRGDEFKIRVLCSKGTYIRSLADDIGKKLGTGAMLTALIRTKTAGFSLDECVSLNDLTPENVASFLKDAEFAVKDYPLVSVSPKQALRFSNGGELSLERLRFENQPQNGGIYRVKSDERFLGLGEVDTKKESLKIKCLTYHPSDDEK
ncbi:MAG: tRNA pseudouridine(55) synthase TruB [Acutalibacteraceae bacterium]|nr:tRNA pseudouridine(55) synthase TruB [Acutalibacteraceae bacterium]